MPERRSLPAAIASRLVHTSPDTNVLNLQRWAIEDLNVTPYPETRVYRAIARQVCGSMRDPAQLVLIVREQRMFFARRKSAIAVPNCIFCCAFSPRASVPP